MKLNASKEIDRKHEISRQSYDKLVSAIEIMKTVDCADGSLADGVKLGMEELANGLRALTSAHKIDNDTTAISSDWQNVGGDLNVSRERFRNHKS